MWWYVCHGTVQQFTVGGAMMLSLLCSSQCSLDCTLGAPTRFILCRRLAYAILTRVRTYKLLRLYVYRGCALCIRRFYVIQIVPCKRLRLSLKLSSDLRMLYFRFFSPFVQPRSVSAFQLELQYCDPFMLSNWAKKSSKMRHLEISWRLGKWIHGPPLMVFI